MELLLWLGILLGFGLARLTTLVAMRIRTAFKGKGRDTGSQTDTPSALLYALPSTPFYYPQLARGDVKLHVTNSCSNMNDPVEVYIDDRLLGFHSLAWCKNCTNISQLWASPQSGPRRQGVAKKIGPRNH